MTTFVQPSFPTLSGSTPQRSVRRRVILALAYLFLSVYAFGGAIVEEFVYYPAWKLVGAAEFAAFHRDMGSRLVPTFVAPFFLSIILNGLLLWFRPAMLPIRLVIAALALNLLIFVVTVGWAIPIQMQLSQAQSLEAIDRLIAIDRPLRLLPFALMAVVNVAMLLRRVFALTPTLAEASVPPLPGCRYRDG